MPAERLYSVRDLVQLFGLSRSTVMGLLARGEIESLTIRRARRVRESALLAFIEARVAQAERRRTSVPGVEVGAAREAGHGATESLAQR